MCADPVRFPPPQPSASTAIKSQKPPDEAAPEHPSDAPESSASVLKATALLDKKFKDLLLSEIGNNPAKRFASSKLFLKQRLEAWAATDRWKKSEEFTNKLESFVTFIDKQSEKDCFFYLIHEALDICTEWPKRKSEHKHAIYLSLFFLSQEKTSFFEPQHRFSFAMSLFQLQSELPSEVQEGTLFAWADFLPDFDSAANQWQWLEQLKDAFSLHGESMNKMSRYVSRLIRFAVKIGDDDKGRLLKLVHDLLDICETWKDDKRKAKAISSMWRLDADKPRENTRSVTAGKSLESFLDEQDHFPLALRILSLQAASSSSHQPETWSRIGAFDIPHFQSDEIPWQWMEPAKDAFCKYGAKMKKDVMSNALRFLLDAAKKSDRNRTPALAGALLKACQNWEVERKADVHTQLLKNLPPLFINQKDRSPLIETVKKELETHGERIAEPAEYEIIKELVFCTEHIDANLRQAHIFDMIQLSQSVRNKQSRSELLEHVKAHNKNHLSQKEYRKKLAGKSPFKFFTSSFWKSV